MARDDLPDCRIISCCSSDFEWGVSAYGLFLSFRNFAVDRNALDFSAVVTTIRFRNPHPSGIFHFDPPVGIPQSQPFHGHSDHFFHGRFPGHCCWRQPAGNGSVRIGKIIRNRRLRLFRGNGRTCITRCKRSCHSFGRRNGYHLQDGANVQDVRR